MPYIRPPDYYAEMVKSDAHMIKVKAKLLSEQKENEVRPRGVSEAFAPLMGAFLLSTCAREGVISEDEEAAERAERKRGATPRRLCFPSSLPAREGVISEGEE